MWSDGKVFCLFLFILKFLPAAHKNKTRRIKYETAFTCNNNISILCKWPSSLFLSLSLILNGINLWSWIFANHILKIANKMRLAKGQRVSLRHAYVFHIFSASHWFDDLPSSSVYGSSDSFFIHDYRPKAASRPLVWFIFKYYYHSYRMVSHLAFLQITVLYATNAA